MKNIKIGIFCAMIIATIARCSMDGETVTQLGTNLNAGTTIIGSAPGVLGDVGNALTIIYRGTQLYSTGKEVASYFYPSEEQKILSAKKLESAQEDLELLRARKAFSQCLINNKLNADRGISGLPKICENAAETFALLGKVSEVQQLMAYFNKIRK